MIISNKILSGWAFTYVSSDGSTIGCHVGSTKNSVEKTKRDFKDKGWKCYKLYRIDYEEKINNF